MAAYLVRRLLGVVPLVLGIVTLVFVVIDLAPGDPSLVLISPGMRTEVAQRIREHQCLDCPLPVRYGRWLKNVARGDLGDSFSHRRPVVDVLASALPNTLLLSGLALLGAFVVGVLLGVVQAVRQHSWLDSWSSVISLIFYSMPSFWLALMMVLVFAHLAGNVWGLPIHFPASGARGVEYDLLSGWGMLKDRAYHLVLPVTTLTLVLAAGIARYTRGSMLEVIQQDYVRTARAKGLPERTVILRHALRNALLPVVTLLGLYLPVLFSGTVFIEYVFAWPGMGKLVVEAIGARDYPLIMGASLLFAIMVVIGNLISDVLYGLVDPRVRYD